MFDESTLSTNEYFHRLRAREVAIYKWVEDKQLAELAVKSKNLLETLDRKSVAEEFAERMNSAVGICLEDPEIKGLDFSWYFGRDKADGAYAYALNSVSETAELSKTDLGDESLPGIECSLKHGGLINEEFAQLPSDYSINLFVEQIRPDLNAKEYPSNTHSLILNLFEIWNYKLAIEACGKLRAEKRKALAAKANPFWITMTRQERWPIAIASF